MLCGQEDFRVPNGEIKAALADAAVARSVTTRGADVPQPEVMSVDAARETTDAPSQISFLLADKITIQVDKGREARDDENPALPTEILGADRTITYQDGRVTIEYVVDGHHVQEVFQIRASEIYALEPDSCKASQSSPLQIQP
ncbi:MAG: hypothetical protein D6761_03315 [Candidatus Dadabacteria bacterium]|nr:MAG: hypothetical protein D6761_03315 [Candidatus Dadabacteria bacterium]